MILCATPLSQTKSERVQLLPSFGAQNSATKGCIVQDGNMSTTSTKITIP
jgi:hypothetical protein